MSDWSSDVCSSDLDESDDGFSSNDADEDDGASSPSDDEMLMYLPFVTRDKKGSSFDNESSHA